MTTSRKNLLLVMVDQLGARWLEAAHQGVVSLPNLRRLADEGVTFTNAFTPNPVCSPARSTIATGLTSAGHGVTELGYALDPQIPTFMHALRDAGWRTGAFGKLHFAPQVLGDPDYRAYGFDVTHITEDRRVGEWTDWVERTHPEHYRAALATVWMTMAHDVEKRGLGAKIEAARREIPLASPDYPDSDDEAYPLPYPAEVSQSAWITDRAIDFLESVPADTPFFAHVSYVQPHNPFSPPAEYIPHVDAEAIPGPLPAEWHETRQPAYFAADRHPEPTWTTRSWQHDRRMYFADLAHLDAQLGRLLESLHRTGRAGDTYLVFTSDHGEMLHDHGLLGKFERHYDACIRVPLLISGPGLAAGTTRPELAELTDLAPTFLDMAGLPAPDLSRPDLGRPRVPERIPMLPGRSLLPLCRAEDVDTWRDTVYVRSDSNHWNPTPTSWCRTVRTARYRYSRFLAGGGEQLFDLTTDPGEQHNLATDPAYATQREQLREALTEAIVLEGYPNSPRQLRGIGTF
ncbi:sulfatase family protein [Amycolatopsis jejuensis]|uniref:sulfatase family protein n=1 Tax=Amycolatopsis jejuensis TaxID=330084 RepID=UPI0005278417|nr:sulfatase-like hydrolase/transferase [Amycolatopsis jejuensis]